MTDSDAFDWLFGKKRTSSAAGFELRSYVMNATTIFSLEDRITAFSQDSEHQLLDPLPVVSITNLLTYQPLTRENILEMHEHELGSLRITNGVMSVMITPERVWVRGNRDYAVALAEVIERTSRPRIRVWQLAGLLPWASVALAALALIEVIRAAQAPSVVLTVVTLTAVAVVASSTATAVTYRRHANHWPRSIVRPHRWRDVVANRAKLGLSVLGAVIGAAATLATVYLTAVLGQ